jgi:pimeloyl-ACP methyl ester carboxylesterase
MPVCACKCPAVFVEKGAVPTTQGGVKMPTIKANGIIINYEQQGSGEPLILVPYLATDNACYAFQLADYSRHFTCIALDLRGTGKSENPDAPYSTGVLADDVAALMDALAIERAHISGLSLGGAVGMWLAAKHPEKIKSLSLHSAWPKSDPYLKAVVRGWQTTAKGLQNVAEMVIQGIFPWCFTPELYAAKPDYIESLADFVRSRPVQPLEAFLRQSDAVIGHDAAAVLGKIKAPTQITFGQHDMVTSIRFAEAMTTAIPGSELTVFDHCAHAPIYENVEKFNATTLAFLQRQ